MTGRDSLGIAARRAAGDADGHQTTTAAILGVQTLIVEDFPSTADARALSPNGRAHWTTKRAARQEVASRVVVEATRSRLRPVVGPVRLTFRWVFPDRRRRDLDNATTGVVKCALDALVRGGWIEADDTSCVVGVSAEIRVQSGRRRLEIVIAPAGQEV